MGLDPGTPGSCPEPKEDAQPLSHPGGPHLTLIYTASTSLFPRDSPGLLLPSCISISTSPLHSKISLIGNFHGHVNSYICPELCKAEGGPGQGPARGRRGAGAGEGEAREGGGGGKESWSSGNSWFSKSKPAKQAKQSSFSKS